MIENTERLLRAKRAQKNKRLLYSLGGFLLFFSFFLVYIVPGILRRTNLDKYFLQISENYNISFSYTHDDLIYAVVKMYFIFVYPVFFLLVILTSLFFIYKVNNRIPSICIYKYKEDFYLFLGGVLACCCMVLMFFAETSEPILWLHRSYFSNRFLFSWFLFIMQSSIVVCFLSTLVALIDTICYNMHKGEKQ